MRPGGAIALARWNHPINRMWRRAVLSPFTAARWVYGPYGFESVLLQVGLGRGIPGGEAFDVVLERILTARALLAVGAFAFLVQLTLVTKDGLAWFADWLLEALADGVRVMLLAPVPILLIIVILVAIARPGHRLESTRAALRPIVVGMLSLALSVALLRLWPPLAESGVLERIRDGQPVSAPVIGAVPPLLEVAMLIALCWICMFVLAGAYLVHRNGLAAGREMPLLPPLAAITLVWLLPIAKAWVGALDVHVTEWQEAAGTLGAPLAVTLLAALEIVRLRRRHAIGFRGSIAPRSVERPPDRPDV